MTLSATVRCGSSPRAAIAPLHETDLNLEPRVLGLLAGSIGLGAIVFESGLADVIADLSTGSLALVIVLALATTDHSPGRLSRLVPSAPTFRASSEAATAWLATLLTICGR